MRNVLPFVLAATVGYASIAMSSEPDVAGDLETARAAFAKELEDAQSKLIASVDTEIAKAAKSGSLDAVKVLQKEKAAIEANFDHDSKAIRLRTAVTKYRNDAKAAKDKLRIALKRAVVEYTKELKITEAESIDAELKTLDATGDVASRPTAAAKASAVDVADLKSGLAVLLFDRLPTQRDNEGFVEPAKLGKPTAGPAIIDAIESWTYDAEKNAVAFGYLRIDVPGEHEFRTYNFYDRNALFVAGLNVCPYRGSVTGGSEPNGKEKIALRKGYIPIASMGYVDGRGSVDVTWKPPGQKDFSPVPKELLFHHPAEVLKAAGR